MANLELRCENGMASLREIAVHYGEHPNLAGDDAAKIAQLLKLLQEWSDDPDIRRIRTVMNVAMLNESFAKTGQLYWITDDGTVDRKYFGESGGERKIVAMLLT